MQRLRSLFPLALVLATPCQAQRAAAPDGGVDPLAAFFRVAATVGSPVDSLTARFPVLAPDASQQASLRLTAADRLVVSVGADARTRDAVMRVTSVRLVRTLPDTTALRQAYATTLEQLTARLGPPTRCSDPLGSPSHLYAPQRVARVWPGGPQRADTQLVWTVANDALPALELSRGTAAALSERVLACDQRLP